MLKEYDYLAQLDNYKQYAPLVLRIVLGVVFTVHGYMKLAGGVENVAGFFAGLGIFLPGLMAWIVTLVEFVGGLAVIFGVGTRYFSALIAIVMVVAILTVKWNVGLIGDQGAGMELDLALLAMAVSLMLTGAGPISVDAKLGCK